MKNASQNSARAMTGFMGLGFAQSAGGASPDKFFEIGRNQSMQSHTEEATVKKNDTAEDIENAWVCECGSSNVGKFCSECGAKKVENEWICSCRNVNTGKFCSECGNKKQDENLKACPKCGAEFEDVQKPPKFCLECGEKLN